MEARAAALRGEDPCLGEHVAYRTDTVLDALFV